ncbi:MAG: hypothetical protein QOE84_569 [Actinomycetota bacterium]|nr:hypothetical protein [Actinomycetota bacterium]
MGERDPAQPLLTLYDETARVELSGATTANWVAKSANLIVDDLGAPDRVGLLLPLHWQTVALLLAGAATGATVVLAADAADLAGCGAAFVLEQHAAAALAAGVDDVLALSGHPLGAPAGALPGLALDYAREVPGHGDHFGGPRPPAARVQVAGAPVAPVQGVCAEDRVLTTLDAADPAGAAVLLGALAAGAGLVLLRAGDAASVAATERVTLTAGIDVPGLTRVG